MKELLIALQKMIPEGMRTLSQRYAILRTVYYEKSIGRRALAAKMNMTERVIRAETEFLKETELIDVQPSGMSITESGIQMLDTLQDFMYELRGIHEFEESLRKMLQVKKVIIVPGDMDEDPYVKNELGKQVAKYFLQLLHDSMDITLTGGTTVASFVEMMPKRKVENVTVVPARGSVGYKVEYQANTLAASLAKKLGAYYKNFSIPDNLSKKAMESIVHEKGIQEVIQHMKKADILICGIGNAMDMAKKRNLSDAVKDLLIRKKAVTEAFGYYFSENKELVYISRSIGIKLEDVKNISHVIAIAGGKAKAKCIASAPFLGENACVVIDEGVATELKKYLQN